MKKPTVIISSIGPGGNIYSILANVRSVMSKKAALIRQFEELKNKVFNSESYKQAIAHIREYVDLIDTDGEV